MERKTGQKPRKEPGVERAKRLNIRYKRFLQFFIFSRSVFDGHAVFVYVLQSETANPVADKREDVHLQLYVK